MLAIVRLVRPEQWYKNLLVFVPLVFVSKLFAPASWPPVLLGFIGLCMISSAGYVINDMHDEKTDRRNPEKSSRPIASRSISRSQALVVLLLLLAGGLLLLLWLSPWAAGIGLGMVLLTTAYTFMLRNEPVLDVSVLSINFVLRAAVGAVILGVMLSPWLILCTFFLALVLSVGKRLAEVKLLGAKAVAHRQSLRGYTPENAMLLMGISSAILLVSYALYSFIRGPELLMVTLPFAFYAVMRHVLLAMQGSKAARHPHLLLLDTRMIVTIMCWGLLTLAILYAK